MRGLRRHGRRCGANLNLDAIIARNRQFDLCDGGLDLAVLGMAGTDRHDNVKISTATL